MPIYPPRNTAIRKKQIFDYKVFEFLKSVDVEEPQEKIEKKAEAVRTAKLNLIKARQALTKSFAGDNDDDDKIRSREKFKLDKEKWESFTVAEIKERCMIKKSEE